jgi:hypothetical protein
MERPNHGRCPDGTQHDWVVVNMYGERDMRAYYHIRCNDCGAMDEGNASEIPVARF